jgi:hypothetical protein
VCVCVCARRRSVRPYQRTYKRTNERVASCVGRYVFLSSAYRPTDRIYATGRPIDRVPVRPANRPGPGSSPFPRARFHHSLGRLRTVHRLLVAADLRWFQSIGRSSIHSLLPKRARARDHAAAGRRRRRRGRRDEDEPGASATVPTTAHANARRIVTGRSAPGLQHPRGQLARRRRNLRRRLRRWRRQRTAAAAAAAAATIERMQRIDDADCFMEETGNDKPGHLSPHLHRPADGWSRESR